MKFRKVTLADAGALASLNEQLIRDEGLPAKRSLAELELRMRGWLATEYSGVIFEVEGAVTGYALWREEAAFVYLRQFFVCPEFRRRGLGRAAMQWLRENPWKASPKVRLEVLVINETGKKFWKGLGFSEYCITMELPQS